MATSHKNRGLAFENAIQNKCNKLKDEGVALISKVPTEFKMIRGAGGRVVSAFPVAESCFVDFCGIIGNGIPIAIEAKETKNKTSFPFSNIKEHQIEFLKRWEELGGKGYYIIRFSENEKVFLVKAEDMHDCIESIGRKSVPYKYCLESGKFIELDYEMLNFEDYIL